MNSIQSVLEKMFAGNRAALARLISYVENRSSQTPEILSALSSRLGHAQVIGITGPPGAGKSTLVDQMILQYRQQNKTVGVIAVDPSSPFTGGALLGDRIRMMSHAEDPGVFIRSLGSRGAHGGLSKATRNVVRLFDAFGMDIVLVETVGVGQTEMDVLKVAHTMVVVLTPESGDTIQTLKAGLLEGAHVFAINKADREGAHKIHQELRSMLEIEASIRGLENIPWQPTIFQTQAARGIGVIELINGIATHYQQTRQISRPQLKQQRLEEFYEWMEDILRDQLHHAVEQNPELKVLKDQIEVGALLPFSAAFELKKKARLVFD